MTDNEIVKSLELEAIYCRGEGNMYGPTKKTFVHAELIEGALALINRQKAEIERLEDKTKRLKESVRLMLNYDDGDERIKAEAVKEFAERLKDKAYPFPCAIGVEWAVPFVAIDNLVKEFTEGKADD